jgi:hypothetical protein
MHHHVMERITMQHLGVPNSNGLQERVFLVYKHIDNALR